MKNRKGFTLVELLVVITIIGIITVLALPGVQQLQARNRNKKFEAYTDSIESAGKLYTDAYSVDMFGMSGDGCYDIPYSELKGKSLIKDYEVEGISCNFPNTFVQVKRKNNKYSYAVSLYCEKDGVKAYQSDVITACDTSILTDTPHIEFAYESNAQKNNWTNSKKITIKAVASEGMIADVSIYYGWTTNPNVLPTDWTPIHFENEYGETELTHTITETGRNGQYYLYVDADDVIDSRGRFAEDGISELLKFDNDKPATPVLTNDKNNQWVTASFVNGNPGLVINGSSSDATSGIARWEYNYPDSEPGVWHKYNNSASDNFITTKFTAERDETVNIRACDYANNCSDVASNVIKIDKTKPVVSNVKAEIDSSNNRYLYADITDSLSKVSAYAVTTTNTTPAVSSFTDITDVASYQIKYSIPLTAGTYYVWGMDAAGNISDVKTLSVANVLFTITYDFSDGTAGDVAPTSGITGKTVTVSNPSRPGWTFDGWTVTGTGASISGTTLTIGTSNITLKANFKANMVELIDYLYNNSTYRSEHGLTANDPAANKRYSGSVPLNYVKFNGELWRVIGTFNVGGSTRLKLLRNDLLVDQASWDSSSSSVNTGQGVNEWSQADIMYLLNEYYAGTGTTCRYCQAQGVSSWTSCSVNCASSLSKLSSSALGMISSVTWNTGAVSFIETNRVAVYRNISASSAYSQERGSSTGKQCVTNYAAFCYDTVARYTTWTGKVGLIYPSDYAYASTNSSCISSMTNTTACKNSNWMHITAPNIGFWTMSPSGWWNFNNASSYIDNGGFLDVHFGHVPLGVRPAVYLNPNVIATSGTGTSSNPYIIQNP